ncbi:MAG: MBL fold metallo-hydrolase [Lachnospiraceae bacterium]|nr:MBL fold metallo-hydrolase [Lachnospiraceae bacterium]
MNAIDFSPKHNILIRHKDGILTPMDVPYYETTQIDENTWQIMSSGDYHYLLVGDEAGVAIDTGYGAGNLREYLEKLCGKPVPWVINTHHHFDHSANNFYFDMAYMGEEALPLASIPYPSFDGITFPAPDYPKTAVSDGDIISLKGRELEIIRIGDHTADGIAILDRTHRLLFTGDEIMEHGKTLNGTVSKWKNDLEKLLAHKDEFDAIYGGAQKVADDALEIFYEAACKILDGEEPVECETQKSAAAADGEPRLEKPHKSGQRPPMTDERDADGHIIYDCQFPHSADVPKDGFFKKNPNMIDVVYRGYQFSYDKTML